MYAVKGGHESIYQSLVSLGSKINIKERVSVILWVVSDGEWLMC